MSSNVDFAVVPDNVKGVNPNHPCHQPMRILDADAGLIERTREKIAIVGYATSTRDMAPFDDPTYDVAGLNQIYRFLPREDVHMDIHINWDSENVEGTDHRGWLRDCGIPVLMTQHYDDIPTSVAYPVDAVIQIGTDYLTSSVAFYIAWAIHQGYKEIALYGIDLVVGPEYQFQKACAEFWLGIAHERGIIVHIPPNCALLKHTHRYGYQKEPNTGMIGLGELAGRAADLRKQRDQLLAKLYAIDGAIAENRDREQWPDPVKRLAWLHERHEETKALLGNVDGAAQESEFWHELLTLRLRSAVPRLVQG